MANKSKKNKNYQARKDSGNKKTGFAALGDNGKPTNALGFGIDPETGKVKNVKLVTVAVVLAVILFVGARMWATYQATGYNATALPYIEEVLPEISKWDEKVMKSYMAEETLFNISEYDFKTMMASLTKLGELRTMGEPEFQAVNTVKSREGITSTIVTYNMTAKYTNGDADLILVLKQTADSYKIYRFNVDSKALSN